MTSPDELHLKPPFRAEHVGSLLRPSKLLRKRRQFEDKKCTIEELQAAEDEAIKHVVKLQQDVGMKTITDGEMRRSVVDGTIAEISAEIGADDYRTTFFEGIFDTLEGMTVLPHRECFMLWLAFFLI